MSHVLRKYTKILIYTGAAVVAFILATLGLHDYQGAQGPKKTIVIGDLFVQSVSADVDQGGDDDDDGDDGDGG